MISPNIPFKLLSMKANFSNLYIQGGTKQWVNKYPTSAYEISDMTPVSVITEQRL